MNRLAPLLRRLRELDPDDYAEFGGDTLPKRLRAMGSRRATRVRAQLAEVIKSKERVDRMRRRGSPLQRAILMPSAKEQDVKLELDMLRDWRELRERDPQAAAEWATGIARANRKARRQARC